MTASPSSLAPVVAQLAQIAAAGRLAASASAASGAAPAPAAAASGDGSTPTGFAEALRAANSRQQATDAQTAAQLTAEAVTDAAALAGLVMPWIIPLVPAIAAGADALASAADAVADATAAPTAGGAAGRGRLAESGLPSAQDAAIALVRSAGLTAAGPAPAVPDTAANGAAGVADESPAATPATAATALSRSALVTNPQAAAATATPARTALADTTAQPAGVIKAADALTADAEPAGTHKAKGTPAMLDAHPGAAPRAAATLAAAAAVPESRTAATAPTGVAVPLNVKAAKTEAAIAPPSAAVNAPMAPTNRSTATAVAADFSTMITIGAGLANTDMAEGAPELLDAHAVRSVSFAPATTVAAPNPAVVAVLSDVEARKRDAAVAPSPAALTAPMAPEVREPATLVQAIDTQVAAPGWREAVAHRLADFVAVRAGDAEIRLNPAHLGPVGVEISYKGNEASVLITAAQPATRDALEQALPHLRELLAQQGIALGQANVRDPGSGNAWAGAAPAAPDRLARDDDATAPPATPPATRAILLVDTFA